MSNFTLSTTNNIILALATPLFTKIMGEVFRDYTLNGKKTATKMKRTMTRENIHINETMGGLVISMNFNTYDVMKRSASVFYDKMNSKSNDETGATTTSGDDYHCIITPVFDNIGKSEVECRFKVLQTLNQGRTRSVYTFNLYHTKCSCLVNGKQTERFSKIDFPLILTYMERMSKELGLQNKDFQEIFDESFSDDAVITENIEDNTSVKSVFVTRAPLASNSVHSTSIHEDDTTVKCTVNADSSDVLCLCPLCNCDADEGKSVQCDVCEKWLHHDCVGLTDTEFQTLQQSHEMFHCPDCSSKSSTDNCLDLDTDIRTLLENVLSAINTVSITLASHIQTSENQVAQLRDEIHSIKSCLKVNSEQLESKIDCVESKTASVNKSVDKLIEKLEKRLQSISDNINRKQPTTGTTTSKLSLDVVPNTRPIQVHQTSNVELINTRKNNADVTTPVKHSDFETSVSDTQPQKKTLMLGSSLLKGINPRGLVNTDVNTNIEVHTSKTSSRNVIILEPHIEAAMTL